MSGLLDQQFPDYDVHEVHSLWVPAPPEAAYEAVKAVSAREVRLFGPLMALRTVGRSNRIFDPRRPLLDAMLKAGFATETRIAGTDTASTRRFRAYWLLIRLGSGAIRRSWLKAIRRRLAQ